MEKNRVEEIDIAKGIGIVLVIVGHCLTTDSFLRSVIYSFHMPLFFFLSGMVLKRHDSAKTSFDLKILSYYIVFSLVYISFDIVFRWHILKLYNLKSIMLDVYLTITFYGINVLWFLSTLLGAKAIVYAVENYFSLDNKLRIVASVCLFTFGGGVAYLFLEPISGVVKILWYPICNVIRSICMSSFILLGYSLKGKIQNDIFVLNRKKISMIVIGTSLSLFFTCYWLHMNRVEMDIHKLKFGVLPLTFLTGLVGTIGTIAMSALIVSHLRTCAKFFAFFGKNSLLVMVTHEYLLIRKFANYMVGFIVFPHIKLITIVIIVLILEFLIVRVFTKPLNEVIKKITGCFNMNGF